MSAWPKFAIGVVSPATSASVTTLTTGAPSAGVASIATANRDETAQATRQRRGRAICPPGPLEQMGIASTCPRPRPSPANAIDRFVLYGFRDDRDERTERPPRRPAERGNYPLLRESRHDRAALRRRPGRRGRAALRAGAAGERGRGHGRQLRPGQRAAEFRQPPHGGRAGRGARQPDERAGQSHADGGYRRTGGPPAPPGRADALGRPPRSGGGGIEVAARGPPSG